MRKLAFTAFFALLGAGAFAQTSSGTVVAAGSLHILGQGTDAQSTQSNGTSYHLAPSAGYFYKDRLEVGIGTQFGYMRQKSENDNGTSIVKNITIGIGPYVTQYIPITDKLHFTATGHVGIGFSRNKMQYAPASSFHGVSRTLSYTIGAAPGLTYFATEKIGFFVTIGGINLMRRTTTSDSAGSPSTVKNKETSFNANFSPANSSIGMRYYFLRSNTK